MKVVAIIVTYNSKIDNLESLFSSLPAGTAAIVSDNSTDTLTRSKIENLVTDFSGVYLNMMGNKGLGHAQNIAIKHAIEIGADSVLMMDDDSILQEYTLENLLTSYSIYKNLYSDKIIFCANPIDVDTGLPLNKNKLPFIRNMMSSGALISINLLKDIGYFDEDLFIDYIDYDFGWRAISCGIKIKIVEEACFYHKLGDSTRKIFGFELRIPSPIRHYYQTRNTFIICKRKYVPFSWKVNRVLAIPVKFLLLIFFAGSFKMRLNFYCKGLIDGLLGRVGSFDNNLEKIR